MASFRDWQREHRVAARVLSGLIFTAVFFALSLLWSGGVQSLVTALIAGVLWTAFMYFAMDRKPSDVHD